MMNKVIVFLTLLILQTSCYRIPNKIEPQIHYAVQDRYLKNLNSPFPPLSHTEKQEPWGLEYIIGDSFAKKLDLYRAISTFKRAEILMNPSNTKRIVEIQYLIILSYYLGGKYECVLDTFQGSLLTRVDTSFAAYHDLLLILYESYRATNQPEKSAYILTVIDYSYPETSKKLTLSSALLDGNIKEIKEISKETPDQTRLSHLIHTYELEKKTILKAQALNSFLPGAGYLYLGQKQSAMTAFLLNGLFVAATVHFFNHKQYAAGAITLSFETGWYFGGIYGAGEAAKLYNERIYEQHTYDVLNQKKLFPLLMLRYGF